MCPTRWLANDSTLNITHYEMVNTIIPLKVWGSHWESHKVQLKTDNMALIDIDMASYVRNIWLLTAKYDIGLVVTHIQRRVNSTADILSRWNSTTDDTKKLQQVVHRPIWHRIREEYFEINCDLYLSCFDVGKL